MLYRLWTIFTKMNKAIKNIKKLDSVVLLNVFEQNRAAMYLDFQSCCLPNLPHYKMN